MESLDGIHALFSMSIGQCSLSQVNRLRCPEPIDMNYVCFHTKRMKTMIQIRNVPQSLHRRLKARAAMEGMSMSQYVLREISRSLQRPTREELLQAILEQPEPDLDQPPADLLREERELR